MSNMAGIPQRNRAGIKQARLGSPETNFREFMQGYGIKKNGGNVKRTKGWIKEKAELLKRAQAMASEGMVEELAEKLKIETKYLLEMKKAIFDIFRHEIKAIIDKIKIGTATEVEIKGMKDILFCIKTELGEPSSINRNVNLDKKVETPLTPEEELLISQLNE